MIKLKYIPLVLLQLIWMSSCKENHKVSNTISVISNQSTNYYKEIEELTDYYYKKHDIPAISIGIFSLNKKKTFISRGFTERESNIPTDENSLYQIASVTKTFTGIICVSLANEGKIELEASITNYLDINDTALYEKLKFVKVSHLLLHTSGLPRRASRLERHPTLLYRIDGYDREKLLNDLRDAELEGGSGKNWAYSNLGYAVLGHIIENASGLEYEQLLEKYITKKYSLKHTFTSLDDKTYDEELISPYFPEDNKLKTRPGKFGLHLAASGIYSTCSDLLLLIKQQMEVYNSVEAQKNNHPLYLNQNEAIPYENIFYGYGLERVKLMNDDDLIEIFNHAGDLDGYASYYAFMPKLEIGYVILTSSGGQWFIDYARELERKLIDVYKNNSR